MLRARMMRQSLCVYVCICGGCVLLSESDFGDFHIRLLLVYMIKLTIKLLLSTCIFLYFRLLRLDIKFLSCMCW